MASSLDRRLEKLFSKRRPSAIITSNLPSPSEAGGAGSPESSQQMFPSASFIRPKSARMIARQEIVVSPQQPGRRVQSLPEHQMRIRLPSVHSHKPSSASTTHLQYRPLLTGSDIESIRNRTDNIIVADLQEFQFPSPPTRTDMLPKSMASSVISPRNLENSAQASPRQNTFPPPRADTPPASDPEDYSQDIFRHKKLPPIPRASPPTPEASPVMFPVSNSKLGETGNFDLLDSGLYKDIQRQLEGPQLAASLRKAASHSSIVPSIYRCTPDCTLAEPTFNDFLNLTDDDIAEAVPEPLNLPPHAHLPPSPPSTARSSAASSHSRGSSLLTLTPPYASRPATAAAFEAARIAARYNFDLVYVVNLWPDPAAVEASRSFGSPADRSSGSSVGISLDLAGAPSVHGRTGLTGRLLAAYGLSAVKSPFRISAAVHSKILGADGWIEYRNQDARADEFARGYACAFYTGQFARRGSADSTAAPSNRHMQPRDAVDRGIVFAAYKKPAKNGSKGSVGCSPAELTSIHRDAETLVEMLIDIHVAHQLRQPAMQTAAYDETGPMPTQRAAPPSFI